MEDAFNISGRPQGGATMRNSERRSHNCAIISRREKIHLVGRRRSKEEANFSEKKETKGERGRHVKVPAWVSRTRDPENCVLCPWMGSLLVYPQQTRMGGKTNGKEDLGGNAKITVGTLAERVPPGRRAAESNNTIPLL